mmetsp:Transcript_19907/g.25829  ORF Transcript_19907/g.25829 Transcript_19907/m.25829 type:complete len:194 (-) Transcript_19907:899-1480(-)
MESVRSFLAEKLWDPEAFKFAAQLNTVLLVVFWFFIGYYYALSKIPFLQRYKIQNKPPYPSEKLVRECLVETLLNHFILRPILLYFTWPVFKRFGAEVFDDVAAYLTSVPTIGTIAFQVAICMQIDDFWFYWSHRLLHHRSIYKYIHKKHHEFRHTIPIAVEYAHPVEDFISNTVSTLLGPFILRSHLLGMLL